MDIHPTLSISDAQSWRPMLTGLADDDLLAWYHAVIPQLTATAVLVEVGVWRGRSLLYAAELLAAHGRPASRIYGIDPYRYPPAADDPECCTVSYRDALAGLVEHGSEAELHHVHLVREKSAVASGMLPVRSVDVVLIDGDHTYEGCLRDIRCWAPRLRRGGLLAGHDYGESHPGVVAAVCYSLGCPPQLHGSVWWCEV